MRELVILRAHDEMAAGEIKKINITKLHFAGCVECFLPSPRPRRRSPAPTGQLKRIAK